MQIFRTFTEGRAQSAASLPGSHATAPVPISLVAMNARDIDSPQRKRSVVDKLKTRKPSTGATAAAAAAAVAARATSGKASAGGKGGAAQGKATKNAEQVGKKATETEAKKEPKKKSKKAD